MRLRRAGALLLAVTVTAGCGGASDNSSNPDTRLVQKGIERVRAEPRGFVLNLLQFDELITVRGVIVDDQKYRAQMTINGQPWLDEVVVDDAIAIRMLDPQALVRGLCPVYQLGLAKLNPALTKAYNALYAGQWVVDPLGGPSLLPKQIPNKFFGDNATLDAVTVFNYLEQAIDATVSTDFKGFVFEKFEEEAFDYNPKKDPLPKPGKGVTRYDLLRKPFPKKADLESSKDPKRNAVSDANLRKAAVYFQDGKLTEFRDVINMRYFTKEIGELFDEEDLYGGDKLTDDEKAALALGGVNRFLARKGLPRITQHALAIRFTDATDLTPPALPRNAVSAPLDLLRDRGRLAFTASNDDACRGDVDSVRAARKALSEDEDSS